MQGIQGMRQPRCESAYVANAQEKSAIRAKAAPVKNVVEAPWLSHCQPAKTAGWQQSLENERDFPSLWSR
ncbi:hypothetical protein SAMN05421548_15317 [Paraburkholderia lycopersici]|uniref:Uncharacterized protein n=1 Tax=Paraburkholderia lycopersici TaxID=416944 RepID=A0A1G7D979_9BURK|nr:hypothetical protein SAMN05421548_15317 [Paraburkholderia lycopersici]